MPKIDKIKFVFSKPAAGSSNPPKAKKQKKNAVILCRDESRFWTTQKQFWQWVRELKIEKVSDNPLTGRFIGDGDEKMVLLANTVLDLKCPSHLSEALRSRRLRKHVK